MKTSKNKKVLVDFIQYCDAHPEERFWQALRNFSGVSHILAFPLPIVEQTPIEYGFNTFYFEEKDK